MAARTGRILGRLIGLPSQGLSTGNALDGTEGTITAGPTGRYLLIATNGPRGYGEILRWAIGERHLAGAPARPRRVGVTRGAGCHSGNQVQAAERPGAGAADGVGSGASNLTVNPNSHNAPKWRAAEMPARTRW